MNKMLKGCLFGIAVFPMLEPLQAATMAQHRPLNPNLGNEISAQGLSPVFKKPKIEFKEQSIMNQKNENVPQKGETIIQTAPASPQLQEESDSEEEIYDADGLYTDEFFRNLRMIIDLASDCFHKNSKKNNISTALANFNEAALQKKTERIEFQECLSIFKNDHDIYIQNNFEKKDYETIFKYLK